MAAPTSHPPPHTQSALNLLPQTAWNLLFSLSWAGGGAGCWVRCQVWWFWGASGRFLTPTSSILHSLTQGPHNPLCWDWWPAVVRETNTLLKQAYMDITGRLVTPFMDVSQMTAFLESKCILMQSFHCVNDNIYYNSTLNFLKVIKIPTRVSFPPCIVFNSIVTWKWQLWKWHFQHFW